MLISNFIIYISLTLTGAVAGYYLAQKLRPIQKEQKEIENKLVETQKELSDYQQKVADHFRNTSKDASNLSKNFESLLEQLASGALQLANTDISRQILNSSSNKTGDAGFHLSENIKPPKDYAPKVPGGVLNEKYGLDETKDSINNPANSDSPYVTESDDDPTLNIN